MLLNHQAAWVNQGQEQQLTCTYKHAKKGSALCDHPDREQSCHTLHVLPNIRPPAPVPVHLRISAIVVVVARGLLKPSVVLTPRLLIPCDRCIPLGGGEPELFIKAHESIRSCAAVGCKCVSSLYSCAETRHEKKPVSIMTRVGLDSIETGCYPRAE